MPKYRLTGASTPWGGAQWDIVHSDRDIAVHLIDELEDRRILFECNTREDALHCAASASYVREFIGTLLRAPGIGSELKSELKMIREAFRTFMTELNEAKLNRPGPVDGTALKRVLDHLREAVGDRIGILAAAYDIEVSRDLATIVPNQNDWFFQST
ncbi:DUF6650 family protein [Pseudarthrobacter equi]|uniref:DUF6650 family protein n=1 Tax=Pseudarthrobacter equi TaxID=728066 RepID=UPI0028D65850|nr:DUF6650 family protein [Pseudarthrobacter equi]